MTTWLQWLGIRDIYSYHILKGFGDKKLFWWPMNGFGQYCTVENEAIETFENMTEQDPEGTYELVKYPAVTSFRWTIIGITGECTSLRQYPNKN